MNIHWQVDVLTDSSICHTAGQHLGFVRYMEMLLFRQRLLSTGKLSAELPNCLGPIVFVDFESSDRLVVNRVTSVLASAKTQFQEISIFETPHLGIALALDGIIQLAESDEYIYHELLVHPAAVSLPELKSALVLGGGDGCAARELLKYKDLEQIEIVEIDGQVVTLCRTHLGNINRGALDDPRVTLIVHEAEDYLRNHPSKEYDLVLADLTEPYGTCGRAGDLSKNLFSKRFYGQLKKHLSPGAIFVIQSGGIANTPRVDQFHQSVVERLTECFASIHIAYEYIHSYDQVWTLTFASDFSFDLPRLDPDPILKKFGIVDLRYYDTASHRRAFNPPKHLRLPGNDR